MAQRWQGPRGLSLGAVHTKLGPGGAAQAFSRWASGAQVLRWLLTYQSRCSTCCVSARPVKTPRASLGTMNLEAPVGRDRDGRSWRRAVCSD